MKIARVAAPGGRLRYAILQGEAVELIKGDIFGRRKPSGIQLGLAQVRLSKPIDPPYVLCLGKNFRRFPDEESSKFPELPLVFIKSNTSVIGPGKSIILPAMAPDEIYYEAELAVIIGRRARNVGEKEALGFVFGYTVANDLAARDCQTPDGQWARAKSFDTFCPLGPWIETSLAPGNCPVRSRINGVLVQDSMTSLMIFNVAQTVSFLSRCMTLLPGTVICMGSPGVLQDPRPLLKAGDLVEVEVVGIGAMTNPVMAETDRSPSIDGSRN
jgi:2-keto-4-pentenoate hydratase/2-oxohepta-3-ene-1,7-dioic acid hydratase in catechol pathway